MKKLISALKAVLLAFFFYGALKGDLTFVGFLFWPLLSPFQDFPVPKIEIGMEGFFEINHNASTTRLVLSLFWYSFLLGILSTFPLYQLGYFKNQTFYKAYRKFWQHGTYICAALVTMLNGFIFIQTTTYIFIGIIQFILWYFLTKILTINVADRQYNEHYPSTN